MGCTIRLMKTFKEFISEVYEKDKEKEKRKLTPKEKSLLKRIIEKQKKQPKQKQPKLEVQAKKVKPEEEREPTTKVNTSALRKSNPESGGISNYSARPHLRGTIMTANIKPMEEDAKGYIPRDLHRRSEDLRRQGINPDNPSRMNTNLQFRDPLQQLPNVERKIRQFVPDENLPPKINPSPKKGRLLKNVLPGGKKA